MLCTPHINTLPAPLCVDLLTIGTISNLSASLKAVFHNTSTGSKTVLAASSSGAGLVTCDVSDVNFSPNTTYILNLYLASGNIGQWLDITIGTSTENEIYLRFEDYKDGEGDIITATTFTLTES